MIRRNGGCIWNLRKTHYKDVVPKAYMDDLLIHHGYIQSSVGICAIKIAPCHNLSKIRYERYMTVIFHATCSICNQMVTSEIRTKRK